MKSTLLILFCLLSLTMFSQNKVSSSKRNSTVVKSSGNQSIHQSTRPAEAASQHQTITEKRLNGSRKESSNALPQKSSTQKSPFAGGIHPANNAAQKFDSVAPANPNSINNRPNPNATIAGVNDSAVNVNTLTENGIPTNSGAVDKSGQAQFGQTNWGGNRGTVGESQWTVPPPITTSFNKDFPTISNATWVRSNLDTSIYSARYQSGAVWVTTNYNVTGQRLDTRSELSLTSAPVPVYNYLSRQPKGFKAISIYKVQMQGKPDMYEVQSSGSQTIYLNAEGMEVKQ